MQSKKYNAVVIGGGIIGASILYHLAKRGWGDSLLLEKSVLTAGSTWHAAANGNTMNAVPSIARLQKNSIRLYHDLETETGICVTEHRPGGILLATSQDRMKDVFTFHGRAKRIGVDYELLSPAEVGKLHPLTNTDGIVGAFYDPTDGHVDPYGVTQALAKGARIAGASVLEHTEVLELHQETDGSWLVVTNKGEFQTNWIVNAAGLWADKVAKFTGSSLPMTCMEHHYLITEDIPELVTFGGELPLIRDPDASFYMRQENKGLLLGVYEADARSWALPETFGQELLPDDIGRLLPNLELAFNRFPVLADVGIKRVVNGPFVFTPDGRPLVGPMPGQRNHFCAAGFLAGISMGGGYGEVIADWIIDGEAPFDLMSSDIGRFGNWSVGHYATESAKDLYAHRYQQHYPHEERMAGRPVRQNPLYSALKARGAVFGSVNGWERPLWFAPKNVVPRDEYCFERQNWFETVGEECRAVRNSLGMMDGSVFGKYRIEGPEAVLYLSRLLCSRLPDENDQIRLAYMLDNKGGILGEFTILRESEDRYFLVGASAAQIIHLRWMLVQAEEYAVTIKCVSDQYGVLCLAGPRSFSLLEDVLSEGSVADFGFFTSREIKIGGISGRAMRLSMTGEAGFELYCDMTDLLTLFTTLEAKGRRMGLIHFGARALDSLRLEKGYARFGSDLNPDLTPIEADIPWAVDRSRSDFIGAGALAAAPRYQRVMLEITRGVYDPIANESIYQGGDYVGHVTSAGFGHCVDKILAQALISCRAVETNADLSVDIYGDMREATICSTPPYDPEGIRMRGSVE